MDVVKQESKMSSYLSKTVEKMRWKLKRVGPKRMTNNGLDRIELNLWAPCLPETD